jgi:hypothetical protein
MSGRGDKDVESLQAYLTKEHINIKI